MGKRKVQRSSVVSPVVEVTDSESNNFSDSDNDCNSGKRIRFDRPVTRRLHKLSPKEDKEHTYSCTPIFRNLSEKDKDCNSYSSESDCEESSSGRRISERSTSIESTKGYQPKRKPKCHTKNAVMARKNRQKKKEYVEGLEGDVKYLTQFNKDLKLKINKQQGEITTLKNQIQYLRSALMNNKEIGMLLRRVCGDKMELNVTSSLLQTPQEAEQDITAPVINYGEGTNVAISDSVSSVGNSSPDFNIWDDVNSSAIQSQLLNNDHSTSPVLANCDEGTNVESDIVSNPGYSSPEFDVYDNINSSIIQSELLNSACGFQSSEFLYNDLSSKGTLIDDSVFNYLDADKMEWPLLNDDEAMDIGNFFKHTEEPSAFDFAEFQPVQSFGVCLHVANKQVSLEFCDSCNRSALRNV